MSAIQESINAVHERDIEYLQSAQKQNQERLNDIDQQTKKDLASIQKQMQESLKDIQKINKKRNKETKNFFAKLIGGEKTQRLHSGKRIYDDVGIFSLKDGLNRLIRKRDITTAPIAKSSQDFFANILKRRDEN